jgi:signal transduction histidine kinase
VTIAETLASSAAIAIDNARLVAQLQQHVDDLEQRNAELDAFDHTVAHDLQNPLALVQGFADLLYYEIDNITHEQRQSSLNQLVIHTQRMSNIVAELLMLSSVRKSDVVQLPISMNDIVTSALLRVGHLQEKYQPEIILPDSWPVAMGHAPWIEEIWDNYLSNALKYGGEPPVVELGSTLLANGRIQFWVQDNGEGIPAEKLDLLFTPFTRLSEVRVTGHGLGLSIVSRIMEKLGGNAWATSEIGKGSRFSFTLEAYSNGK